MEWVTQYIKQTYELKTYLGIYLWYYDSYRHLPEPKHHSFLLSEAWCLVFFSIFCFLVLSEELAYCINPQPEGPGDFLLRFSSSSP
jgi:hypothetical protein